MATQIDKALSYSQPNAPRPAGALQRAAERWSARTQRRREIQQLLAMDDRALADIGLTRTDALWVANDRGRQAVAPPAIADYVHRAHVLRGRAVAAAVRSAALGLKRAIAGTTQGLRNLAG